MRCAGSEAIHHLLDLAGAAGWLQHVTLFVNHARIAELPLRMSLKALVADAPGDDAMLEIITSCSLGN